MRKSRHKGVCPPTGKRIYTDRLDCLLDHQNNPRTIRAYKCKHIHPKHGEHYHATSKPQRNDT